MNKTLCSLHDQEEEKYICIHPTCLKNVNNKLCCIYCNTSNHKQKKLKEHQFINVSELGKIAIENYQSLKTHLTDEIQKNSQLHTKIEERLQSILLSLSTWQNNQKKMFNDITENSSQILSENIKKADSLMKNPSLDTFIYFYKLNIIEKQNENYDIRDQSTRQLEYQLNQIEMKRDILINQISFIQREHFLNFAQMDYKIELANLDKYEFEKCETHLCQKKMLCTHPNCLQNNNKQLQCMQCIAGDGNHQYHQEQNYIKTISVIKKESDEKQKQIEEQKKKFIHDIKKSIDMNLSKINESQLNLYQNYEKQKEKAVFLEQQQLSQFLNPEVPNYIFGQLDSNLITKTKEQINFYYQQLQHNFEIKCSNIFSNQVNVDLKFCTELDFNSKIFYQYSINLEQETEFLKEKLQEKEKIIQSYEFNDSQIKQQLKTQNDQIRSFHITLETSITKIQYLVQTNADLHTLSNIKSLEKQIATLQSQNSAYLEKENGSIKRLTQNLDALSSNTEKNSQDLVKLFINQETKVKKQSSDQLTVFYCFLGSHIIISLLLLISIIKR